MGFSDILCLRDMSIWFVCSHRLPFLIPVTPTFIRLVTTTERAPKCVASFRTELSLVVGINIPLRTNMVSYTERREQAKGADSSLLQVSLVQIHYPHGRQLDIEQLLWA